MLVFGSRELGAYGDPPKLNYGFLPMKRMLLGLSLLIGSSLTQAAIYDISVNNSWQDLLTGYVDTKQDALFVTGITPWSPGLNHYMSPVSPNFSDGMFANGQWRLDAVNIDGSGHDIADNWDGKLGGSWGFSSNIDAESINYLDASAPSNPFFKFYMSIGISKMYLPLADIFSYSPHPESTLLADGSYHSGMSHFLSRAALVSSPGSLDDFAASASLFDVGMVYVLSKREEVPESGSLLLLLVGLFSFCVNRFVRWERR
jgi:hypothetical protein